MTIGDAPQGPVPAIGIPDSQDFPRLVYAAPYFTQVPLAELIAPAVTEAVEAQLPSLVPPYVDQAAQAAVQQLAVLLAGSTMQGPLYLNPVMPTQPAQAASMAYVDSMIATAGIPEVPPTPVGQVWARMTGQWTPISEEGGTFLPIGGGTMQGQINMGGNAITNLPALPVMPNGAAPAQWVLNQIASVSLYQGTWDMDTYVPDLTQLSTHVNGYTWIAITASTDGVVIGPPIPGLQGQTVFNGDTVIYSATAGAFQSIHAGGLSLPEAQALFLQLAGGQLSGPLLLNANATQPTQATTLQQVQALVAGFISPEAPTDGQGYLRIGATRGWTPGLPLTGGVTTGAILLSGNATNALQAVPYQQLTSYTAGNFMPLAGATMTGPIVLSGNASAGLNPVPLQQLNSMLGSYMPLAGGSISGNLAVGGNAAITGAVSAQQFATPTGGAAIYGFNATRNAAGTMITYINTGMAASLGLDGAGGFDVYLYPSGTAGSTLPVTSTSAQLIFTQTGYLTTPSGLLSNAPIVSSQSGGGHIIVQETVSNWMTGMYTTGATGPLDFAAFNNLSGAVAQWYGGWTQAGQFQTAFGIRATNGGISAVTSAGATMYVCQGSSNYCTGIYTQGTGGPLQFGPINSATDGFLGWYGGFESNGNLNIAGTLGENSDVRNKHNIVEATDGLEIVRQLVIKRFIRNKPDHDFGDYVPRTEIGLIAQEVQEVLPEAVHGDEHISLGLMPLIAVLINAVKQLSTDLDVLKAKVA